MKKTAFLTGTNGQDGSYLAELLLEKGYEVHGMVRRASTFNTARIDHLYNSPLMGTQFFTHYGDVTDANSVNDLVRKIQPDEVYNLAAQSVVEDSLIPILNSQTLEYKTFAELWETHRNKCDFSIENFNGIPIEVLTLSDATQTKALGYWNGMGTWFKIKQISRHYWKDKVVKLNQKFGSITVTPNHSILNTSNQVCKPSDNPWLLNVRKLNYQPNQYINDLKINLLGRYKFDENWIWLDENGKCGKIKRSLLENDLNNFCKFVGAFVSEGHTTFNKCTNSYLIGISNQKIEWLKEIEFAIKNIIDANICYVEHKKEGFESVWELQIKSRALYMYLRNNFGTDSHTKELPRWTFQLKPQLQQQIFKYLIEGDGCYTDIGQFRYTTASYKLACQLSMLFTMLKYDYTVNEEIGGYYHFRECSYYQFNQGDDGKKIEYIDYDGWVYDISVDEVSNFSVGVGNIVVHNSHVKVSFEIPQYTAQVDAIGTLNILEAVRNNCSDAKVYQASTSELFGGMGYNMPEGGYTEESPFHPRSPYGVAKIYGFWATKNYREAYDLFACNGLLFNHESPRRGETFVTRKITLWFADYCLRRKQNLTVIPCQIGNVNAYRDWGHAKDFVAAMHLILQQDKPDDYVIATGEAYSVKDFFNECFALGGWTLEWHGEKEKEYATHDGQIVIQVNPKYYRPSEVEYLLGNPKKAVTMLGWKPQYNFKSLVRDMVESDLKSKGLSLK